MSQTIRQAVVRLREDADADALVSGLAQVHAADAYPLMGEHVTAEWLYDTEQRVAWVALVDGVPVGHIAVTSPFGSTETQEALGRPAGETLGITRFFIAPAARGAGAGGALMDAVDAYATEHGRALALDVIEHNTSARALYERRGWTQVGSHAADWFGPDGPHPVVLYYVRPPAVG